MTTQQEPHIALVDDHALIVETLTRALLRVGIRCTPVTPKPREELLAALLKIQPTVALLDLDLGVHGDSTSLITTLTEAGIRVVVLTGQTDRRRLGTAFRRGAVRIVPKSSGFDNLVETIRTVTVTNAIRPDPSAAELLKELAVEQARAASERNAFDQLTDREKEVLTALAHGLTVRDIANRWYVAETTVRSHVRAVLQKLDSRSQLQAVVRAVQHGWILIDEDGSVTGYAAD